MKWDGQRESDNVEDYRDSTGDGGGGGGFSVGGRGLGLGGIAIALIASWVLGVNPLTMLGLLSGGGQGQIVQRPAPHDAGHGAEDPGARFVKVVLGSTEDVWTNYFAQSGQKYPAPHLALFRGRMPTACGTGEAAMGPFYCPADHKVYIDLSFYDVLSKRLGAPGEFAQAYVVAHEVGHHIQNLLGTSEKLDRARGQVSKTQYNALSVRLELQADCYAGVWASKARSQFQLEQADIDSALNAASQIGDDTLQRKSQGTVVPESFTHGSSEQRVRWFTRGLQGGRLEACDTFGAKEL
ncbi:MAG: neutral zinc metallopeptidase [Paucibacter sp.]|nr:neutral zinc metallopeptidase [Roseateles sp.]